MKNNYFGFGVGGDHFKEFHRDCLRTLTWGGGGGGGCYFSILVNEITAGKKDYHLVSGAVTSVGLDSACAFSFSNFIYFYNMTGL